MLPNAYEVPAAVLLVLGGALACFAGYRLFRLVLGIYGFILGAMIGSALAGSESTVWMIGAALLGGVLGSMVLMFAYFVGIAIVGAGLGALVAHVGWSQLASGDPSPILVVVAAAGGAIGAMVLQRYVIIVATAFGGAWTLMIGALALMAHRSGTRAVRASGTDAWIFYPWTPASEAWWVPVVWIALGLVGTAVQIGVTGRGRK
jgi:hypothetical protein